MSPLLLSLLILSSFGAATRAQSCPQKNCCRMTEAELNACRGIEKKCPAAASNLLSIEDASCAECPPGQCRLKTECVCPTYFLEYSAQQKNCKDRFPNQWPQSADEEEIDRRHCRDTSNDPVCKTGPCCSLSESDLQDCRGVNPDCPKGSSLSKLRVLDESCDECPAGTCRDGGSCVCPTYFLDYPAYQKRCKERFNFQWPQSVGQEEIDRRHCNGKVNTVGDADRSSGSSSGSTSKSSSSSGTASSSDSGTDSSSGSSSGVSTELDSASTPKSKQSDQTAGKENESKEDKLSTPKNGPSDQTAGKENELKKDKLSVLEIVGILVGILSALVTIGSVGCCWKRSKGRSDSSMGSLST